MRQEVRSVAAASKGSKRNRLARWLIGHTQKVLQKDSTGLLAFRHPGAQVPLSTLNLEHPSWEHTSVLTQQSLVCVCVSLF